MKTKFCLLVILLSAVVAHAQTNLMTLLQQGLFEEQANRNLDAAIADYQSLAIQFDKDRQLAATAIFRLGECYRMEGKTNEAAQEYQRILNDFSDQTALATLSRENLVGMGMSSGNQTFQSRLVRIASPSGEDTNAALSGISASSPEQTVELWEKVKDLSPTELEKVLPALAPNAVLTRLLQQRDDTETKLSELQTKFGPQTPDIVAEKAVLEEINSQISGQINGTMQVLKLQAEAYQNSGVNVGAAASAESQQIQETVQIQSIQEMIQNSPDLINAPDNSGITPLENAAMNGQLKVAAYLLDHGADVNLESRGQTPLIMAAGHAQKTMVDLLLSRGADVNAGDDNGATALLAAARHGFEAVVQTLLANHADVNRQEIGGATALCLAASSGRLKIVQMLIAAGAKTNLKDNQGRTALNYAIATSPEIVQALLAAGTGPNTEDSQGRTPLSYAAERDTSEVVKLLLDAKANPNDGELDAPLLIAIHKKDAASADLLLQAGAEPNMKGKVDWQVTINGQVYFGQYQGNPRASATPLWLAISENDFPIVQLLLKYKADPNDTQTEGHSLLSDALDSTNILEALLDASAKANSPDLESSRESAFESAVSQNKAAAAEILLNRGANPNFRNLYGETPLHDAALTGSLSREIFVVLLDHQADPNVRDTQGRTPLGILEDRIAQNDSEKVLAEEITGLLRQHGALDNPPDWDRIQVSGMGSDHSAGVFQRSTNNWNRFTLLETILDYYESKSGSSGWYDLNRGMVYPTNPGIPFPDLARVTIMRPNHGSTNVTRIKVRLINGANEVDCSNDVPLKFGDVVDIPSREHTLAESDTNGPAWISQISSCLQSRSGSVKLIVAGGQTIQVQLGQFGPLDCGVSQVLNSSQARNVLMSDSDLSRVRITRRDPTTGKTRAWILNCAGQQSPNQPQLPMRYGFAPPGSFSFNNATSDDWLSLWLRDGDIIEVPESQ